MRSRGREGPEWERGGGGKSGTALGMERDRRESHRARGMFGNIPLLGVGSGAISRTKTCDVRGSHESTW